MERDLWPLKGVVSDLWKEKPCCPAEIGGTWRQQEGRTEPRQTWLTSATPSAGGSFQGWELWKPERQKFGFRLF